MLNPEIKKIYEENLNDKGELIFKFSSKYKVKTGPYFKNSTKLLPQIEYIKDDTEEEDLYYVELLVKYKEKLDKIANEVVELEREKDGK